MTTDDPDHLDRFRTRGAHAAPADGPASTPPADPSATIGAAVDRADAPDPEDPRKPPSPPDLTRPSWRYALRMTVREFQTDNATDLAAALTYFAVLALFPAVLALVSVFGLFGDAQVVVDRVMALVDEMAGDLDLQQVQTVVEDLASQDRAGIALITGLVVALWSASGYVAAFSRAMNRIYEIDEGRPFWKLRPVLLLVTLVTVLLVAVTLAAMVLSGPVAEAIGGAIGLSDVAVTVWDIAKWLVIAVLVALTIALLYWATPNVRQPRFRWISVGSFVALLVWALGTAGFAFYVATFGRYGETYGALAGVIVFLLWLWITNNALLFGAELDAELERARELQAGIAAEETLQLPPRDTRASAKRRTKGAQAVAAGRALRLARGRRAGAAS
nr:YhjD/YihY/BrkB family envelope integrity protein [Actinotalea fermentans]